MPSGFKVHTYFPIVVPYSQVYGRVFPYASLGIFCEFMTEQIKDLSVKVEKHNEFNDRLIIVEQSVKSAHKRLDMIAKGEPKNE